MGTCRYYYHADGTKSMRPSAEAMNVESTPTKHTDIFGQEVDYNAYSANMLAKIHARAHQLLDDGISYREYMDTVDILSYGLEKAELLHAFMENPDLSPQPVSFYRIGEPRLNANGDQYAPSTNFAEDRAEDGVSVVTTKWLNSLKSVFFGAHDDARIAARGVYKVRGVIIGYGGDDEPLIYPIAWAEKTNIKTYKQLARAVRALD